MAEKTQQPTHAHGHKRHEDPVTGEKTAPEVLRTKDWRDSPAGLAYLGKSF
ncbi:hypothetical protein KJ819_02815 [Patescibacteria group bacterium]|nr:hypothetical protein [Patescibacteria group bacterium]MBU1500792.1 hypothetical protein [Patescibacteria group bacterium]MBU2080847.1 hypothetical protein [Patescibacteria group bacterium]MBU2123952.1 hypothetical protein [Patescibacteria group bacterium]MBU2194757.1 hypothetical protein [Patescibacteria group bacterium]